MLEGDRKAGSELTDIGRPNSSGELRVLGEIEANQINVM